MVVLSVLTQDIFLDAFSIFPIQKRALSHGTCHMCKGQLSLPLTRADIDLIDKGLTPKSRYNLLVNTDNARYMQQVFCMKGQKHEKLSKHPAKEHPIQTEMFSTASLVVHLSLPEPLFHNKIA